MVEPISGTQKQKLVPHVSQRGKWPSSADTPRYPTPRSRVSNFLPKMPPPPHPSSYKHAPSSSRMPPFATPHSSLRPSEFAGSGMAKEEIPPTVTTIAFHDGEKVIYTENFLVDSTMGFKQLQSAISKRIGVAHHLITLALVTGDPNAAATNLSAHKLPLKAVFHEPSSYLLALLHPSPVRTSRRRRRRSLEKPATFPTTEKVLLRRNPDAALSVSDFRRYSPTPAGGLPDDVLMAARQRRFLMRHYGPPRTFSLLKSDIYNSAPPSSVKEEKAVCEVCEKAKGGPAPEFHPCVNDRVMSPMEFRYDYGPTQKPSRGGMV